MEYNTFNEVVCDFKCDKCPAYGHCPDRIEKKESTKSIPDYNTNEH